MACKDAMESLDYPILHAYDMAKLNVSKEKNVE